VEEELRARMEALGKALILRWRADGVLGAHKHRLGGALRALHSTLGLPDDVFNSFKQVKVQGDMEPRHDIDYRGIWEPLETGFEGLRCHCGTVVFSSTPMRYNALPTERVGTAALDGQRGTDHQALSAIPPPRGAGHQDPEGAVGEAAGAVDSNAGPERLDAALLEAGRVGGLGPEQLSWLAAALKDPPMSTTQEEQKAASLNLFIAERLEELEEWRRGSNRPRSFVRLRQKNIAEFIAERATELE
ncbi:unnamed protein product, partial [Prorocentrum cordatum]